MTTDIWRPELNVIARVAQHGQGSYDSGQWNWEPSIVLGLVFLIAVYVYGVGPRRYRHGWAETANRQQMLAFMAGCLVLFLTLVSPLDVISDGYLFSAHMVQHILLAGVVAPLLLMGVPGGLLRPLLKPWAVAQAARVLTSPVAAFLVFNGVFWLWHWPPLYELALADERVHIFQHLTLLATGILNWWPALSPLPELPRPSYPLRLLYLFANCQPNVVLGAIFVFSRHALYTAYVDAPRLFDISPLTDQQIGGLIMWIPGSAVYWVAMSIIFLRWFQEKEPS